jgi:predicted Zn-dependent protease
MTRRAKTATRARGRWLALGAAALVTVSHLAAPAQAGDVVDSLRTMETRLAGMVVSREQQTRIGLAFKNELEKKGVVYMEDPAVLAYVRGVAERVIDVARQERPDVRWSVMVIDDRKTVNACATPGGFLYVYRGLLEAANDEAELAGVLAHEAGHVIGRHIERALVAQFGLMAVSRLALGRNAGLLARLTAGVGAKGLLLAHSREEETESDEYGARYAAAAGYDPQGVVRFLRTLKRLYGSDTGVRAYLSDHPANADRVEHMTAYIAERGYTGTTRNRQEYADMKRYLVTLPTASRARPQAWYASPAR